MNPLANSDLTITNLINAGAVFEDFTWDRIKAGETSLDLIACEIAEKLNSDEFNRSPIILSICGDSVLGLPSSAGTSTIGYAADDVYKFISIIFKKCHVSCFTIAELKTSLNPSAAPLVGEFLTQCLYVYHRNTSLNPKALR